MLQKKAEDQNTGKPAGFTPQSGGLASEYAREQGWGTNEEERTKAPSGKQDFDGGTNYDYGARDFGDTAIDTGSAQPGDSPKTARSRPRKAPQSQASPAKTARKTSK